MNKIWIKYKEYIVVFSIAAIGLAVGIFVGYLNGKASVSTSENEYKLMDEVEKRQKDLDLAISNYEWYKDSIDQEIVAHKAREKQANDMLVSLATQLKKNNNVKVPYNKVQKYVDSILHK